MAGRIATAVLSSILLLTFSCAAIAEELPPKEYALLYSMTGYAQRGTKRAFLRQLSDMPTAEPSSWKLCRIGEADELTALRDSCEGMLDTDYVQWINQLCDAPAMEGRFTKEPSTFQVTVHACDFSQIGELGSYALLAELSDGTLLTSKPFVVSAAPLGDELLPALSIDNAQARYAAGTYFGGYYDCNTKYGEAYSHGTYLNGLSNYALYAGDAMAVEDQKTLQWAASVGFDYLMKLHKAQTGEIMYKSPERPGDLALNGGIHNSMEAVCGLAAYMDAFAGLDQERVNEENRKRILQTVDYIDAALENSGGGNYLSEWKTSVLCHLYRGLHHEEDLQAARESALTTLENLDWEHGNRSRTISVFEGLWLLSQIDDEFAACKALEDKVAVWKQDIRQVLEKSAYHFPTFSGSWETMSRLSLSTYNNAQGIYWVLNQSVLCQALDACFLWQLTGDELFEQMAAGALHYVTGLNFGLPDKMSTQKTAGNEPVTCCSFATNCYGGIICWDLWMFQMQNDQWASIVNGYTYDHGEYQYTNADWQHGETFIRMDGAMLYAGSLYEMLVNAR